MTTSAPAARPPIDLDDAGVDEAAWLAATARLPRWRARVPGRRVVVVAPHPDDETLGVGGTVGMLAAAGAAITIVCATDGEAAPTSLSAEELADRRRRELRHAVRHLAPDAQVLRLGLPDGHLAEARRALVDALVDILEPGDLVLATLDGDGHPDHDAAGAAARLAAMVRCAELWWYPVWAWHWHDPEASLIAAGRRVELTPAARRAKAAALAEYTSQVGGAGAVVPARHVRRCTRPFEVLVAA